MMNWKESGRKLSWSVLRQLSGLLSELTEDNYEEIFSQNSRFEGRNMNRGPPQLESGIAVTHRRRSI